MVVDYNVIVLPSLFSILNNKIGNSNIKLMNINKSKRCRWLQQF